ncbi:MAG: hypothetical protein K6A44_01115 [bacterium]|nr:hypothetical protein [bacterium]
MEINELNFEQFKSDRIVNPFEDLDVNSDGKIDSADKNATNDINIFNQISYLLNSVDEDDEDLELIDDFDDIETKTSTSQDCSDGSCEATAPAGDASCPNGDCSVSAPSTNNNRVYNADGTYTETKTNASGQTVAITYDAKGKRISVKTTNKDGSVVNSTYKYNDDGSYSVTSKYADKTRVTKYNSAGKRVSYTETYKNGTKKTATFKYNSNGSYSVTIKNQKSGTVCTKKYNSNNKITSSVTKTKKNIMGQRRTTKKVYSYNSDGSYKVTSSDTGYMGSGKVSVTNYDANGKKVKAGTTTNTITTSDSSNYKDKLNKEGVTFVIFTGTGCGHCSSLKNNLKSILPATEGLANFTEINIRDAEGNRIDSNSDLMWGLAKKYGAIVDNTISLPMVVKYVNGKPAGVVKLNENNSAKLLDQIRSAYNSAKSASSGAAGTSSSSSSGAAGTSSGTTNSSGSAGKQTAPTSVTSKNYKSKIAKKGVTYMVMGNPTSCGACIRLNKQLKSLMKGGKLQDSTILSMPMGNSANESVMWSYVEKFNAYSVDKKGNRCVHYPLILKFVDGKAVGFVSNISDISDAELVKKLS